MCVCEWPFGEFEVRVDRPVPLRKSSGPNSTREEVSIKLNQTQERGRGKEKLFTIRNIHLTLKYWSGWLCAVVWRKLFCHHSNGALKLMKFGFYRWKVLWTEKTTRNVTSMEKLFWAAKGVAHRSEDMLDVSVCATLDGSLLLSLGRPLNQIWEEKQNHKIKRKLNCVYQFFSCLFEKNFFHPFNNKMISFFPFSLANLFLRLFERET